MNACYWLVFFSSAGECFSVYVSVCGGGGRSFEFETINDDDDDFQNQDLRQENYEMNHFQNSSFEGM